MIENEAAKTLGWLSNLLEKGYWLNSDLDIRTMFHNDVVKAVKLGKQALELEIGEPKVSYVEKESNNEHDCLVWVTSDGVYTRKLEEVEDSKWDKHNITEELIDVVAEYMLDNLLSDIQVQGGYEWELNNGETLYLGIFRLGDNEKVVIQ